MALSEFQDQSKRIGALELLEILTRIIYIIIESLIIGMLTLHKTSICHT